MSNSESVRVTVSRRTALAAAGAGVTGVLSACGRRESTSFEPLLGPAGSETVHVMSYNIRFDAGAAPGSVDSWQDRRPLLARLLRAEQPTVLGVQEALHHQVRHLADDLGDRYEWIGLGREGGGHGEFMSIFFDRERLEPTDYDHFWLSDTPEAIGSKSWGNSVIRMATWVRFRDLRTDRQFAYLNTHFDHQSENSRVRSAQLVRDRIAGFQPSLPVIVTGDFNAPAENSQAYRILLDAGLVDTWSDRRRRVTPALATFHGYQNPVPDGPRIDWILTSTGTVVEKTAINSARPDGRWPSDHLPVQALLRLP